MSLLSLSRFGRNVVCTVLVAIPFGVALAQVPGETLGLVWCPGPKTCLEWSPQPAADSYRVYRGTSVSLPGVVTSAADSCRIGTFPTTDTGPTIDPVPPLGCFHWFLVTAVNASGEGTSGSATVGSRLLDGAGLCASAAGRVVINEIDYDQPGSDPAEFVELYNSSSDSVDLSGTALVFVNGASQTEYARVSLGNCASTLMLPGTYLVVATPAVSVPPGTSVILFPLPSNNIQNGAPDAVALFDTTSNTVLDALSYEGSVNAATIIGAPGTYDLVEGTPTTATDVESVTGSLNRLPNGTDTDDAASDWGFYGVPTPGDFNGPTGEIVINEVDYDQPGTDSAEFVELHNPSSDPVDLTGLVLVLVNGANSAEYARVALDTGTSRILLPGAYLLVATPSVTAPGGTNVILFAGPADNVQNGAPDAMAIFDTVTGVVLDALSYEGSVTAAIITGGSGTYNLVEGSPTGAADGNVGPGSISRIPNGSDTNNAATDWAFTGSVTPGAANVP